MEFVFFLATLCVGTDARSGTEVGLLSLLPNGFQGWSLGGILFSAACGIERVTLRLGLFHLTSGSEANHTQGFSSNWELNQGLWVQGSVHYSFRSSHEQ